MRENRPFVLNGVIAAVLFALGLPAVAGAQSPDSLRRELRLPQPATFAVAARGEWVAPGITIGVPSGFGADYGDAFVAAGLQSRTRFRDDPDGGVVAGFGIGNARDLVGLEVAITSFGTFRSCCRGGIHPKLHRVLPGDASIAVGWENAVTWGHMEGEELATDAGSSLYAAGTKVFVVRADPASFFGSGAVTVGVGNGRFRREKDILDDKETVNVFGSLGVRVAEPASIIASWTGQDLNAGFSVVPLRRVPLFVTVGAADLTSKARLIVGVGYGFDYASFF